VTNFGQQYGPPPQQPPQYGQQHGAPQPYGPPPQQYGGPPQQYGGPPQQYGGPQQPYGAQPQWTAPAQPFPQPQEQQYGQQQVPWGVAPPARQYDARAQDRKAALKQMAIGAVVALVGLVITIVTYRAASGGGHYVVAWGPAIFGLIAFVRGAVAYYKA
jgi:hypothetical protein